MTGNLIRRGSWNIDSGSRIPCEDSKPAMWHEANRNNIYTTQRMAKIACRNTRKPKELRRYSSFQISKGVWPCWHLDLNFSLQNYETMDMYCFKPPTLFSTLLLKQLWVSPVAQWWKQNKTKTCLQCRRLWRHGFDQL